MKVCSAIRSGRIELADSKLFSGIPRTRQKGQIPLYGLTLGLFVLHAACSLESYWSAFPLSFWYTEVTENIHGKKYDFLLELYQMHTSIILREGFRNTSVQGWMIGNFKFSFVATWHNLSYEMDSKPAEYPHNSRWIMWETEKHRDMINTTQCESCARMNNLLLIGCWICAWNIVECCMNIS